MQEQIDNELVPYKLPDGSMIQVFSMSVYSINCYNYDVVWYAVMIVVYMYLCVSLRLVEPGSVHLSCYFILFSLERSVKESIR